MSFQEEERQDKKLKAFLMWVGLAIRDGRAAGFTDAQVVKTLQNQIGAGDVVKLQGAPDPAEPGGVTARAKERGLSTGDFGEWKRARAAVGPAPGGETIGAVGSLLPGQSVSERRSGAFTAEERQTIRAAGKDPEVLAATRGAKNFTEWKERKTKRATEGGGRVA